MIGGLVAGAAAMIALNLITVGSSGAPKAAHSG